MTDHTKIKVLFLASEADPLIKVGGLGDVAGSLPPAIRKVGLSKNQPPVDIDIRLVLPFHPAILRDLYSIHPVAEYKVHARGNDILTKAYALEIDGLSVYLIGGAPIEQESGVYSSNLEEDGYKYVYFSQAALNLVKALNWKPDIVHANDWHTASAVYSLALNRLTEPFFRRTASLLAIHNLPYLGAMTDKALDIFDLPQVENTSLPTWASHMALPLGLLTADVIVAVSPGYSKEIMTKEFGSGLHTFLKAHSSKVTGILNGLDTKRWNPSTDQELVANYSTEDLQGRLINKNFLQNELGLKCDPSIPLLAMVTRLDPQKGVDLAIDALRSILESPTTSTSQFQAVFLGTGDPILEQAVRRLELAYPDSVRARITYNEKLSRHIYAGADILMMPSRYEPCGLSQMIAMHYGSIPIARATGGLLDTVQDPAITNPGTGFLFKQASPKALVEAIIRALAIFSCDKQGWQAMQICGMQQDFSWDRSAIEYIKLYKMLHEKYSA